MFTAALFTVAKIATQVPISRSADEEDVVCRHIMKCYSDIKSMKSCHL